ncbi:C40 family peptidase [Cytobacillus suaedae]|nr:C40 family peptidase [Cytobacillus suaedae]
MKRLLSVVVVTIVLLFPSVLFGNNSVAAASQGEEVVEYGKKFLGVPYLFGGTTPSGFDCSGFLTYVFKELGVELPRTSADQFASGEKVETKNLVVGDLVFFTTYKPGASHAGIYVGDNKFIHASSSKGIMISSLDDSYWKPRYLGARAFIKEDTQLSVKEGQIGVVTIKDSINLWTRTTDGQLELVRVLEKGEKYRVYGYDEEFGGQYNLGGGLYVTNISSHLDYEEVSSTK